MERKLFWGPSGTLPLVLSCSLVWEEFMWRSFKESSLRVAPINRSEAEEMISETKGSDIFKGLRGERPLDTEALVESLLRLSQLVIDFPEIEGIDINPVKVLEKGAVAVDARILLKDAKGKEHSA